MYWGPLFPDAASPRFNTEAVAASLDLETVTGGGGLEGVTIRAKITGTAGNSYQFRMTDDALTTEGELEEDEGLGLITIKFVPDVTTIGQMVDLLAASSLVEMIGSWNPVAPITPDDDFAFTLLEGGANSRNVPSVYWGPLFPDQALEAAEPDVIDGVGPVGAAQFALDLEGGFLIEYEWITDVFKSYSGRERRASILDAPRQVYRGSAFLVGGSVLTARATLERYAAAGSTFLLGLPHLELTIAADTADDTVEVFSTARADWALQGQRVVATSNDRADSAVGVLQEITATTLRLDVEPGAAAPAGGSIMPLVPVMFEPRQGFSRYPVSPDAETGDDASVVEMWSIVARGTAFGFRSGPVAAELDLNQPLTSGALVDSLAVARSAGAAGNDITIEFSDDALTTEGELEEDETALTVHVKFVPDVTTVENVRDLLNASALVTLGGSPDLPATLTAEDVFGPTNLAGGADEVAGEVGRGAELTTYVGRPVFDRDITVENTASESVHSMSDVVDLGSAPTAVGTAEAPDWGRQLSLMRTDMGEDFQWLIKFLWTVRGSWKAFWLSTHRPDLVGVGDVLGSGGTSGTVTISSTVGDFFAWYPRRSNIVVVMGDDSHYLEIEDANDNGDGTITLDVTVDTSVPSNTMPPEQPADRISWLDLCRLEKDIVTLTFSNAGFSMNEQARAVGR